jgi:ATP-binding cassette, subfamily B, bacterial MsbA
MIDFFKTLWALARPYKARLFLGVFCGILAGFAEPLLVLTVVIVFKVTFPGVEDARLDSELNRLPALAEQYLAKVQALVPTQSSVLLMAVIVSAIPLMMFIRGLVGYLHVYLMSWVSVRAISDLRTRLFSHLLHLPLSFFSRVSTGELMSRVGDVGVLQQLMGSTLTVVIKEPISVIAFLAVLFTLQPGLTLVAMLVFPICMLPIIIYARKVRRSSAAIQTHIAELSRLMHESFTGNRIIKAYNLENNVVEQFKQLTRNVISQCMRVIRSAEIPGPLIEFFGAIGVAAIFLYMALPTGGQSSPADLLLFVLAIFSMYRPIKSIIRLHTQVVQARAASERLFQLLATQSDVLEPAHPVPLRAANADIEFDQVDFDYGDKPILRGINLTVKAGQIVALVGSSGSGKTTLTNLLLRFYDPCSGAIRIGGTDLRSVSSPELRSQIAVVTQETILFNESIRDNIALGRPGATNAEIETAARHAHAHEFIMEKPNGYEAMIGEKGVALSGGQRQRLAIARAILKNSPILILDEATSSLDTESERAVQLALDELMEGRTTICIAHRLSTIQHADVIVVMSEGRIIEIGTHAGLLKKSGQYQRLYELQFRS